MKLLFFCKRRPQGRDLLTRPYGRFYHLPRLLARSGHEVSILSCSYKREPDQHDVHDKKGIHWYSVSPLNGNPLRYYCKSLRLVREIRPDWIVGFSDTYYGILAQYLARRYGCRSLIDAYDNYESYMSWCKPLHYLWRRALGKADLVTAAGPKLAELMGQGRPDKPTMVVPMAADPVGFEPLDKNKCRQALGLPSDKKMVGYCGSIHSSRGIDVLLDAYRALSKKRMDIELVLSGRKWPGISLPDGVRYLGYLPDEKIPRLLNCMDVLVVMNRSSSFGNYSYPVKLYEAMCCQVPVVATRTPSTTWILEKFPELLADPDDDMDFLNKIERALTMERIDYGYRQGWKRSADLFEKALSSME